MGLSVWKILIILVGILLVFGGRRLPELGQSLGAGIANFRKSVKDVEAEADDPEKEKQPKIGSDA